MRFLLGIHYHKAPAKDDTNTNIQIQFARCPHIYIPHIYGLVCRELCAYIGGVWRDIFAAMRFPSCLRVRGGNASVYLNSIMCVVVPASIDLTRSSFGKQNTHLLRCTIYKHICIYKAYTPLCATWWCRVDNDEMRWWWWCSDKTILGTHYIYR